MSGLFAICGRFGDVMMSVPSIQRLSIDHPGELDILVASRYSSCIELLRAVDAPVRRVVSEQTMCPMRDGIVTGMFMSSWSEKLLRNRYPGYDRYYNAAPNMAPRGAHMMSLIAYRCGVVSSLAELPVVEVPKKSVSNGKMVVHLGSSDPNRLVCLPHNPFPEVESVCIGLPVDPCPVWVDSDKRSEGFEIAVEELRGASLMVGSDSLFSHVSCLMGIPTLCIHTSSRGCISYSREAYPTGRSMVADRGLSDPIAVRKTLLQPSRQEISDARSDRQEQERMDVHPKTG